jgi:putative ABC transport system ATP-binding protein
MSFSVAESRYRRSDCGPTPQQTDAVICTDLTKTVRLASGRSERILGPVSLTIDHGSYFAITGPSGVGKSTLLGLFGLLDRPSSGQLAVLGHDVSDISRRAAASLRRSRLGFVFQQYHLLSRRTAQENVALALVGSSMAPSEREERARSMLAAVGMEHRLDATSSTLSGGEQQRVAVARALVAEPDLILCDEPTGNLDRATANDIIALIETQRGCKTLVVVTHDPALAARADRTVDLSS